MKEEGTCGWFLALPSGRQPQPGNLLAEKQRACLGMAMPNTQQTDPEGEGRKDFIGPFVYSFLKTEFIGVTLVNKVM